MSKKKIEEEKTTVKKSKETKEVKEESKFKKNFKYVVLIVVLLIPFIYSYFYLKAYWDPYGEGNIDNLPVAIVNNDEGTRGEQLIKQLKKTKKLKLSEVDEDDADDGLYDKTYYAVITIPKDFSSSIESVSTTNKKHPTITYSPNQKSNYLASQIINSVVNAVEKNLDNTINSEIVSTLSDTVESVPDQLETISDGFDTLNDGTSQLVSGSQELQNGTTTLNNSYGDFDDGISQIKEGSETLDESMQQLNDGINTLAASTEQLETLKSSIPVLTNSISTLNAGSNQVTTNLESYVTNVNSALAYETQMAQTLINMYDQLDYPKDENYYKLQALVTKDSTTNMNQLETLTYAGNQIVAGNKQVNQGLNQLNSSTQSLNSLPTQIDALNNGIKSIQNGSNQITAGMSTLNTGVNTLFINSAKIKSGISTLNTGTTTLTNGLITLDSSVSSAKTELNTKLESTKKEVKKVDGLKEYSEEPVTIDTETVNEVSSYGASFSPLFISIGLWIGCLMMYIVLYFDKERRFGPLALENENHMQRTACYHGLATISGIVLAILLQVLLDFDITNIFLYYISFILIANTFVAIIQFLISNFRDIGKFIALILLILQLAAAGGTFPIETVTSGFRWLNGILPMTYTINLLRECLFKIESSLLTKNLIVVICICLVFVIINLVTDMIHDKKNA